MNITLFIPARGAPVWHSVLAEALVKRGHTISIRWGSGPPLAPAVRALLWVEARVFGAGRLGRKLDASERARLGEAGRDRAPDLILDFTGGQAETHPDRTLQLTFDGSPDPRALMGALVAGRSPIMTMRRCSDARVWAASYPSIDDREVLTRALENAYARMIALCLRALERSETDAPVELWSEPAPDYPPTIASTRAVIRFAAREFTVKFRRQLGRRKPQSGRWSLATRAVGENAEALPTPSAPFRPLALGPDTWADPFIHSRDGTSVLFAERQSAASRVGVIACARQNDDGGWGGFQTCLERPYHLSYPFVFDHEGETWMMPETGANRTLEVYRATDYPLHWALDRVVMQDVDLADATLLQWNNRWWLFAAQGAFGGSLWDELVAFHAPSPLGPWAPHALNPLKSDARSARPAGRFIVNGERLYRPAQACEAGYGAGLVWCEVTDLTPTTFCEHMVGRWRGADFGSEGVHSFARGGGMEVIDLKRASRR